MTQAPCSCDVETPAAPTNPPQLPTISYRVGDWVSFRQAVLTPLFSTATTPPTYPEQSLSVGGVPIWRTNGAGDLAVMIAEWFAYVADVIAFYNERIANEDYLRTADLPESVNNLITLLGYRPRPAIGAQGLLAALVSPGPTFGGAGVVLPQGLQFQSKPTPGQTPQFFELTADTTIGAPDQLAAAPTPQLIANVYEPIVRTYSPYHSYYTRSRFGGGAAPIAVFDTQSLLLQGAVSTIAPGDLLLLQPTGAPGTAPSLVTVTQTTIAAAPSGGGQQTSVTFSASPSLPTGLTAATASLGKAGRSASLWSFFQGYSIADATHIHLASVERSIQPGDWLLLTSSTVTPPGLVQVASTLDVIWDAKGTQLPPLTNSDFAATVTTTVKTTKRSGTTTTTNTVTPMPIPHTLVTLESPGLPAAWLKAVSATIAFGWTLVGTLLNQPFATWSGSPTTLVSPTGQSFPAWGDQPILLQDSTGLGVQTTGTSDGDDDLLIGALPDPVPDLQPPFLALPNLLAVTRGKTVANEILGSGDATNPAQDFKLSQSPVTYLANGAGYRSTIALTVNGQPWKEVPNFYGLAPNATVFVTREDNQRATHVMFGDGVNGARLPTGVNNVVATYRIGAGAASPPAGKLTVIAKSYPGLRAVLNPVAVYGGADPVAPDQIRQDAPRSVLTFGRAVSVFDFQALAAQVPGVARAGAVWAWNDDRQRALVTVYVGDDSGAATAASAALAAAGDPNRPVVVKQAAQIAVALDFNLLITPGMDADLIGAAIATALTDPEVGVYGVSNIAIGQAVFDSQIEQAILDVAGAVAITGLTVYANGAIDPGPLHTPGEGAYYTLDPADINPVMEPDPNG